MRENSDLKTTIHSLVDQSDDKELLEVVYQLLYSKSSRNEGDLLGNLTEAERKELYEAYEDSFDDSNLISLKDFLQKHGKWLEK